MKTVMFLILAVAVVVVWGAVGRVMTSPAPALQVGGTAGAGWREILAVAGRERKTSGVFGVGEARVRLRVCVTGGEGAVCVLWVIPAALTPAHAVAVYTVRPGAEGWPLALPHGRYYLYGTARGCTWGAVIEEEKPRPREDQSAGAGGIQRVGFAPPYTGSDWVLRRWPH